MRAYSSLRQLEEKGICVDEYLTNEREHGQLRVLKFQTNQHFYLKSIQECTFYSIGL